MQLQFTYFKNSFYNKSIIVSKVKEFNFIYALILEGNYDKSSLML